MTDYSKSAVNLCNPPELEIMLGRYRDLQYVQEQLNNQAKALIPPELSSAIAKKGDAINELNTMIREKIDLLGSYQNLDNGMCAIKQRKVSKSYNAEEFDRWYPEYSKAVIVKAIDTTKLNGLIKGNLIKEEDLKEREILKETETYAYIIK